MAGELILYTTEDGTASVHLRADGGTVWLSQLEMAELFQTSKQNISLHIKNVLAEGELVEGSVVKEYLTTASDGKNYRVKTYHLDMILAVGYRVRSVRGTQFRQWATTHLSTTTARPRQPSCSLRRCRTNRIVVMYLDYAEDMARRRKTMTMREWEEKLDAFLQFNEREVLTHAGKISAQVAERLALERYAEFDAQRREGERLAADAEDVQALEQIERQLEKTGKE